MSSILDGKCMRVDAAFMWVWVYLHVHMYQYIVEVFKALVLDF